MSISIKLDTEIIDKIIRETHDRADAFLRSEASDIVTDVKLSFGSSPSSPGEPPGVDTGALRGSIEYQPAGDLAYHVQDGVEYGIYQEHGVSEHNLKARPFMAPVFERYRATFEDDARAFGIIPV